MRRCTYNISWRAVGRMQVPQEAAGVHMCSRCRFPQSRSDVGHCRKSFKVYDCRHERWNQGDEFEHEEDGGGGGNPEETYYEPGLDMAVPEADTSAVPSYEYDAEDIQRFYEFAYVATPEEFQEVLEDGVKHIEIIAHLDMRGSSYAVGSVQSGTVSIVVRHRHMHPLHTSMGLPSMTTMVGTSTARRVCGSVSHEACRGWRGGDRFFILFLVSVYIS